MMQYLRIWLAAYANSSAWGTSLDMYIQIRAQIDVGAEHGKGQRLGYMRPAGVRDDDLHLGMLLGDPHDLIRIRIGHVRAHKKTRRERNDESVPHPV